MGWARSPVSSKRVRVAGGCAPGAVAASDAENVRDEVQVLDTRHVTRTGRDCPGCRRSSACSPGALSRMEVAADVDFSRVELQDARHGFQRRGLARAVVADEAVNLTGTRCAGSGRPQPSFPRRFLSDVQCSAYRTSPFLFRQPRRPAACMMASMLSTGSLPQKR